MKSLKLFCGSLVVVLGCALIGAAQQEKQPPQQPATKAPALTEWKDEFDGKILDAKNWEQYSLEGGGTLKVADGKLRTQGANDSRFGVRSVQTFKSPRFLASAKIAGVVAGIGENSSGSNAVGNAVLTVLFDNVGANRLEWIFTSDGRFEAWMVRDGRSERIDGKNLGTKEKSPTLGIARRGDDFFFMLNGEVGLQKSIKNMPQSFRIMLYGFGVSKDEWESASVITPQQ